MHSFVWHNVWVTPPTTMTASSSVTRLLQHTSFMEYSLGKQCLQSFGLCSLLYPVHICTKMCHTYHQLQSCRDRQHRKEKLYINNKHQQKQVVKFLPFRNTPMGRRNQKKKEIGMHFTFGHSSDWPTTTAVNVRTAVCMKTVILGNCYLFNCSVLQDKL